MSRRIEKGFGNGICGNCPKKEAMRIMVSKNRNAGIETREEKGNEKNPKNAGPKEKNKAKGTNGSIKRLEKIPTTLIFSKKMPKIGATANCAERVTDKMDRIKNFFGRKRRYRSMTGDRRMMPNVAKNERKKPTS